VNQQVNDGVMPDGFQAVRMPDCHDNSIDQPFTRLFSDDMHITMNQDPQDALQSDFFSDVKMAEVADRNDRDFTFV
jgi:hypothetical protein